MLDDFLAQIQSDDFAWRYEENEADREEVRQENLQEESRRTRTVYDVQKTGFKSREPERERFFQEER
jgi:hypothetical protein